MDPLYVVARAALLDALEAVGEQREPSSSWAPKPSTFTRAIRILPYRSGLLGVRLTGGL